MIVHENISAVPYYDPLRYFHFGEHHNTETDNVHLWIGSQGACLVNPDDLNMYIDFEQPNMWYHEDSLQNALLNETRYSKILTVCHYTCDWRNKVLGRNQYVPITYFLNVKYVPFAVNKIHNIIYTGNNQALYGQFLNIMRPFNYRVVCGDPTIDYQGKLNLIAQSKITLVHNLIGIPAEARIRIATVDRYRESAIFHDFESKQYLPQIKTRPFEAAFCKSLILCWRDEYNVIERFFENGSEFVYLDADDSERQIADILKNYGDYQAIIDRAYERAMDEYTTDSLLKFVKSAL